MKAVNIIGIVLAPALFAVSIYYINECLYAYWSNWDYGWDNDYTYYGPSRADVTIEGSLVSLLFTLFYVFLNIFNLVKVKTTTSKVMSIIGMSLTGILLLINLLMLVEPGSSSYDEAGVSFAVFSFIMLAFTIVFLVQANIAGRKGSVALNPDTIDDVEDEIV